MVDQDNPVVCGGRESRAKAEGIHREGLHYGALRLLSCTKAAADLFLTSGQERERSRPEYA